MRESRGGTDRHLHYSKCPLRPVCPADGGLTQCEGLMSEDLEDAHSWWRCDVTPLLLGGLTAILVSTAIAPALGQTDSEWSLGTMVGYEIQSNGPYVGVHVHSTESRKDGDLVAPGLRSVLHSRVRNFTPFCSITTAHGSSMDKGGRSFVSRRPLWHWRGAERLP